ncbi:MAG: hypothetical protein PHT02_04040 [Tissierellia bacterium]|nr:hypothetical protein [Tissierellia bacterium]
MPHISLNLYPGRSKSELEKIASEIRNSLAKSGGWKPTDISVSVGEIGPNNFEKEVRDKIKNDEIILTSDFIK